MTAKVLGKNEKSLKRRHGEITEEDIKLVEESMKVYANAHDGKMYCGVFHLESLLPISSMSKRRIKQTLEKMVELRLLNRGYSNKSYYSPLYHKCSPSCDLCEGLQTVNVKHLKCAHCKQQNIMENIIVISLGHSCTNEECEMFMVPNTKTLLPEPLKVKRPILSDD